jgi:nicotinate-nucleotide--dimethylbenzimidazole phosphoribosyltransferase
MRLDEAVRAVCPPDQEAMAAARRHQARLTKPAGSLGALEEVSVRLAGLAGRCPPPVPRRPVVAVFAGDHGVHAQGVSPWPQEVTAQMVANFASGGAVVNAFARQVGAAVVVVDVGVATDTPAPPPDLSPASGAELARAELARASEAELARASGAARAGGVVWVRRVRAGTRDLSVGPALTRDEVLAAVEVGIAVAVDLVAAGHDLLLTGDMGIANTTPAAALVAAFTGAPAEMVTGRGTGIDDASLAAKTTVVAAALGLHRPDPADPIGTLAAVGGLEHAALAGFIVGGAALRTPVLLDGVIACSAALAAAALAPHSVAAMVAGHRSAEPGATVALGHLGLTPLIDLKLRLGEGTGAALAVPIVAAAARVLHEVATFDSANVTDTHTARA